MSDQYPSLKDLQEILEGVFRPRTIIHLTPADLAGGIIAHSVVHFPGEDACGPPKLQEHARKFLTLVRSMVVPGHRLIGHDDAVLDSGAAAKDIQRIEIGNIRSVPDLASWIYAHVDLHPTLGTWEKMLQESDPPVSLAYDLAGSMWNTDMSRRLIEVKESHREAEEKGDDAAAATAFREITIWTIAKQTCRVPTTGEVQKYANLTDEEVKNYLPSVVVETIPLDIVPPPSTEEPS